MVSKEKLLFLSQRIPYPPNKGDKVRSFNILSRLSKEYDIYLASFYDDPADAVYVDLLKPYVQDLCILELNPFFSKLKSLKSLWQKKSLTENYFYSAHLAKWIKDVSINHNITKAYIFSSSMSIYMLSGYWHESTPSKTKIMDFVDVDSYKWGQYAKLMSDSFSPYKLIYQRESKKLEIFEHYVAQNMTANLFVSQEETDLFTRHIYPEAPYKNHAISNGIDYTFFDPSSFYDMVIDSSDQWPIVFTGAMDYWPNIDAALYFSQEILPEILKEIPNAVFYVVGANPPSSLQKLNNSAATRTIVTGRVSDIRGYIAQAKCIVAPMRISQGIQNKILEGMAMEKPVVTSELAAKPFNFSSNEEILICKDKQDYIKHIKDIHDNPRQAILVGQKARQKIQEIYSWDKTYQQIRTLLSKQTV